MRSTRASLSSRRRSRPSPKPTRTATRGGGGPGGPEPGGGDPWTGENLEPGRSALVISPLAFEDGDWQQLPAEPEESASEGGSLEHALVDVDPGPTSSAVEVEPASLTVDGEPQPGDVLDPAAVDDPFAPGPPPPDGVAEDLSFDPPPPPPPNRSSLEPATSLLPTFGSDESLTDLADGNDLAANIDQLEELARSVQGDEGMSTLTRQRWPLIWWPRQSQLQGAARRGQPTPPRMRMYRRHGSFPPPGQSPCGRRQGVAVGHGSGARGAPGVPAEHRPHPDGAEPRHRGRPHVGYGPRDGFGVRRPRHCREWTSSRPV